MLQILKDEVRFLTFRQPSSAIQTQGRSYLAFGLFFTWLAGIGRYWDNPKAYLWQYLGLGSMIYVFVLALIIWGILLPLRPKRWSYRNVLLFITLTSPPAILYAIPVEQFMSANHARSANAWFLATIATWRVALYIVFLRRVAGFSGLAIFVGALFPLVIIVLTLAMFNLEHVVFEFMSGARESDRSPNDNAFMIVFFLAMLSYLTAPVMLILYGIAILYAWKKSDGNF